MNDNREPKSNSLSQDEPRMAIVHGPGSAHNPRIIFRRQLILELSISPDEQRVLPHNHRRRRKRLRVASNRPLKQLDSVGHFFDRISFNRQGVSYKKIGRSQNQSDKNRTPGSKRNLSSGLDSIRYGIETCEVETQATLLNI